MAVSRARCWPTSYPDRAPHWSFFGRPHASAFRRADAWGLFHLTDTTIATRFVDANGLRFEVTECGDGDGFALCLHGFPESAFSWRHQLPLLARLGYRVWAPNLRGYGRSSRPTGVEDYRIDRLVDDVVGHCQVQPAGGRVAQ